MLNRGAAVALALVAMTFGPLAVAQQPAKAAGPNDAQIAHIVVTANTIDVDAGKLAVRKSHNKRVKAFARRMITDHTAVNEQAVKLVTKLHVKPESNATSTALEGESHDNLAKLKSLKGKAFDRAYIDHEVAYHQQVLDAIDQVLIPNAQNAELKTLLEKTRPAIAAHLDHAKHVQAKLESNMKM